MNDTLNNEDVASNETSHKRSELSLIISLIILNWLMNYRSDCKNKHGTGFAFKILNSSELYSFHDIQY